MCAYLYTPIIIYTSDYLDIGSTLVEHSLQQFLEKSYMGKSCTVENVFILSSCWIENLVMYRILGWK